MEHEACRHIDDVLAPLPVQPEHDAAVCTAGCEVHAPPFPRSGTRWRQQSNVSESGFAQRVREQP
jgi:hypothetical protein